MDRIRHKMEHAVLADRIGENLFKFFNVGRPDTYLVVGARTNQGNVYTLRMELDDFPNDVPAVYVTKMLHDKDGNPLDTPSAEMHVLTAKDGWTRICQIGRAHV